MSKDLKTFALVVLLLIIAVLYNSKQKIEYHLDASRQSDAMYVFMGHYNGKPFITAEAKYKNTRDSQYFFKVRIDQQRFGGVFRIWDYKYTDDDLKGNRKGFTLPIMDIPIDISSGIYNIHVEFHEDIMIYDSKQSVTSASNLIESFILNYPNN